MVIKRRVDFNIYYKLTDKSRVDEKNFTVVAHTMIDLKRKVL